MADVNGSSEPIKTETVEPKQEMEQKVEVGGGGDCAMEQAVTEVKSENIDPIKTEKMDPDLLAKKIKRQIEYYFGDYNLPTDKFLKEQIKTKDGWVPLETMIKFRRLSALTSDPAVIVSAVSTSELVQVSEDKTEVRRHPDKPLPVESESRRKEILTRSVYVKGFPKENFAIDNALDFFEQYGSPDDVVMRYYHDKAEKSWKYKGSCFVVYPTKDAAAAFLAIEEMKFGDTPLIRMWQDEYIEKKRKERLELRMNKTKKHVDDKSGIVKQEEKSLPKNATLHMTKCPDGLMRETIKERLEEMGVTVAFIEFNSGDDEGWIRLHEADTAPTVLKECEQGILKLKDGVEVEVKALEGEEEEKFLETAQQNIFARRAKGGKQRGGRRGGGRGNRGGGGRQWGKRRNDNSGGPPAKVAKTEGSGGDDSD